MAKEYNLYDQTRKLLSKREKSDKPIIVKVDLTKRRVYMVWGRTTFFSRENCDIPNFYAEEYIKFLRSNNFDVTVVMNNDDSHTIKSFKARLKTNPNHNEVSRPFHEEI